MENESLKALSVGGLKAILKERGVDFSDCVEKGDLVNRVLQTNTLRKCSILFFPLGLLTISDA